ncbi:MAG: hypothetical protein V1754_08385 [Pseudomonadota bacterium]
MHCRTLSLVAILVFLCCCGDRAITQVHLDISTHDGNTSNTDSAINKLDTGQIKTDFSLYDGTPHLDSRLDIYVSKDANVKPPFCSGQVSASLDNNFLKVSEVKGGLVGDAACCPPGEYLRFTAHNSNGKVHQFLFEVYRYPGVQIQNHIDFQNAPKGWLFSVKCNPFESCDTLRSDQNADFVGTLDYNPIPGQPAAYTSLCLSITPKKQTPLPIPLPPGFKSLELVVDSLQINSACVYGMDQTCNENPYVSALMGKCNENSTCTCILGATKIPLTGKCN